MRDILLGWKLVYMNSCTFRFVRPNCIALALVNLLSFCFPVQAETIEQRVQTLEADVSELQRLIKGETTKTDMSTAKSEVLPSLNSTAPQGKQGEASGPTLKQKAFDEIIRKATQSYKQQSNEVRKSMIREERKKQFQLMFMDSCEFSNWIGTLTKISTSSDGHAEVVIRCGDSRNYIYTIRNMIGLISLGTVIEKNTQIYKKLGALQEGQLIRFSGKFESGDSDFISELSLTEAGSMSEPDFNVSFSDFAPF